MCEGGVYVCVKVMCIERAVRRFAGGVYACVKVMCMYE